jgi:PAS domain S-box-containing protein
VNPSFGDRADPRGLAEDQQEAFEDLETLAERAERAEAMYRSLVERLPAITYAEALDDGRTLSISPQVEAVLGYTQEEWMENPLLWLELMHPDDRDRVVESCHTANQTREPFRTEYRMIARDGRVVWIRDEAALVKGSHGQPLCWQGVMLDITTQKRAEETLTPKHDNALRAGRDSNPQPPDP